MRAVVALILAPAAFIAYEVFTGEPIDYVQAALIGVAAAIGTIIGDRIRSKKAEPGSE